MARRNLPRVRGLFLLLGMGLVFASGLLAAEGPGSWLGLSLEEALRELGARGVRVVFTSRLVRPEMRVDREPTALEPREILHQLLAPHGLTVEEKAGGTLVVVPVVVPAGEGDEDARVLTGVVRSRDTSEPLGGVLIRALETGLAVRTRANGTFALRGLAPGTYTLEARLQGFVVEQKEGILVGMGAAPAVSFSLPPAPFLHDEIVVRPSELSLFRQEPAAPLSLSRDEIESLPHLGGDLFRALSVLPGTAANDRTAQFHLRGGRRDEVQILLDGQEIYEAYHLQDFDNALSILPASGLDGASLSTGAFPADHGDRMGGVLDLTTSLASRQRWTRLSLSLLNAAALAGGPFGQERGSWFASGRRGSTDLADRILGQEDPAFWDLFTKARWQLDGNNELRAHLLRADDRLDFRGLVNGDAKDLNTKYRSSYFWLTHGSSRGERLLVETTLSGSRIRRDRRGAEDEVEQTLEVADRRRTDVLGLRQAWDFQATPEHSLRWGFEARRYQAEYDYFQRSEPDFVLTADHIEPRPGLVDFARRFRGEHLGAYFTGRFSPAFSAPAFAGSGRSPLTLELGLRYDRHTLTDDTLLSPRINAAWRLGEASVLRAAWGLFFQSQRPYELAVQDGESHLARAERSEQWLFGYERLLSARPEAPLRALRIEVYRREIRDPRPRYENLFEPVNLFPEVEPDRVRIVPEHSRAEGVEVVVRGALGSRGSWWANYAWATTEDRIGGETVRRMIDQPHTVNLNLGLYLGASWHLNLAWRFHTGWPTTPVSSGTLENEAGEDEAGENEAGENGAGEITVVPVLGRLNSARLSDYHRLDLRLSRRWRPGSGTSERDAGSARSGGKGVLTFFVDIQNLYDRKNLAGFDLSIDEQRGALIIAEENWTGIFPSLGISWEF